MSDKKSRIISLVGHSLFTGITFILVSLLFFSLWAVTVLYQNSSFPSITTSDAPLQHFSEERAKYFFDGLEKIGPTRAVGTRYNNDTLYWLRDQVHTIIEKANQDIADLKSKLRVEYEEQGFTTSGFSAPLYNVLVRISDANLDLEASNSSKSLMLSTHYDSVFTSPGGSDDGVGVVTLLELLRNVLYLKEIPTAPIIFLIDNFEEGGLYGAFAFAKYHRWSSTVARFLNIDSTGGPGKALMFRLWPSSLATELVHMPYPHASVIGEELISVLPSDTDFTAFTRASSLPGFDFAYYMGGYTYHTRLDTPSVITPGSIQALGENLMALTKVLAYGDTWINNDLDYDTHYVYFDFIGLTYIYYSQTLASIIQCFIIFLGVIGMPILIFILDMVIHYLKLKKNSTDRNQSMRKTIVAYIIMLPSNFICLLLSGLCAIACPLLLALVLNSLNKMSWYSSYVLSIFLYGCPSIVGALIPYLLVHVILYHCCHRIYRGHSSETEEAENDSQAMQASFSKYRYLALSIIWALVLIVPTVLQTRSFYFVILTSIISCILIWIFAFVDTMIDFAGIFIESSRNRKYNPIKEMDEFSEAEDLNSFTALSPIDRSKPNKQKHPSLISNLIYKYRIHWIICPILISIFPSIMGMEMLTKNLGLMIPMLGRFVTLKQPDLIVSALVSGGMTLIVFNFLPLMHQLSIHDGKLWLTKLILIIFIALVGFIVFIVALFTFPYTSHTPKRIEAVNSLTTNYRITIPKNQMLEYQDVPRSESVGRVFLASYDANPVTNVLDLYQYLLDKKLNVTADPQIEEERGLIFSYMSRYEYMIIENGDKSTWPSDGASEAPSLSYQFLSDTHMRLNISWYHEAYMSEVEINTLDKENVSFEEDQEKHMVRFDGYKYSKSGYYSKDWVMDLHNVPLDKSTEIIARRLYCERGFEPPMLSDMFKRISFIALTGKGRCLYIQNISIIRLQP